ncbi:MAG: lysophospholipid acyltransferase family protein [Gemmatimonadaceae bacterium]
MIAIPILATISALISTALATIIIGTSCIVAAYLRVADREGSPYDVLPRKWSWWVLNASGVKVTVQNIERARLAEPHIFVANHISWYDIPALASFIPRAKFVAKAELFRLPIFGLAMRSVGMVPIQRENRKAAFGAYTEAANRIREGNSVLVFPEGSRGDEYPLRPFKKGPFVLAIDAGASIVPVLIYGSREVVRRGSMLVHPRTVDVHLLEPVGAVGYTYDDRDALAELVRGRIAAALESLYGIKSPK